MMIENMQNVPRSEARMAPDIRIVPERREMDDRRNMPEVRIVPDARRMPDMTSEMPGVCVPQEMTITGVMLAHAYVPIQKLCTTFSPMEALRNGTAFPPLVSVYRPDGMMSGDTDE